MADLKAGDIVYHKASERKGVLARKSDDGQWWVKWNEKEGSSCGVEELWTEEEHKKKEQRASFRANRVGRIGGILTEGGNRV